MLRAIRFAAKLDFTIDPPVVEAIHHHASLLANVPPARLFDEFLKLFQTGHAEATFILLWQHGLFQEMFPATTEELENDQIFAGFVRASLQNTDRRVAAGKSVTPMFLLGVFFWAPVKKLAAVRRSEEKMTEAQSLSLASYDIVAAQQRRLSIPRRFTVPMREMLSLQPRFAVTRGKRGIGLLQHRRFRAAYDFMVLRAEVGQFDSAIAKFWTDVQAQSPAEQAASFQMDSTPSKKRGPRSRRRRKKTQNS